MSKNVIINGVTYADVPYVNIPLSSGSGNAKFVDTDSGDAAATDIRNGKKAWVGGDEITGSVPVNTETDITVSGKTVNVPAGIYDNPVSKSVEEGGVRPSATVEGNEIGMALSEYEIVVRPTAEIIPGYISSGNTGTAIVKYIQVESKNATPSTSGQTITPSAGKLLNRVNIAAVSLSGNATEADVLNGKTFYSTTLEKRTGSATVPVVGQDSTTKVLSIS